MARYAGWVPRPFAEVWPHMDHVAASQGWQVGATSTMDTRHYNKGVSAFSWGANITVYLQDSGTHTRVTIDTSSTSLVDFARAKGVVEKLLTAFGGTLD